MENFKEECAKFSKIGLLIAKNLGQGNYATDEWKERNEDFENWCKKQTFLILKSTDLKNFEEHQCLITFGSIC